jgi:hypothetical protein
MKWILCVVAVLVAAVAVGLPLAFGAVQERLLRGQAAANAECEALGRESVRLHQAIRAAEEKGNAEEVARLRRQRHEVMADWRRALRASIPPEQWAPVLTDSD